MAHNFEQRLNEIEAKVDQLISMIDLEAKLDQLLRNRMDTVKLAAASAGVRESNEALGIAVAEAT